MDINSDKGPVKIEYSYFSCGRCDYLKSTMLISGRKPEYEYHCQHPEMVKEIMFPEQKLKGFYIGSSNETPQWCPMFSNKKSDNNPMHGTGKPGP